MAPIWVDWIEKIIGECIWNYWLCLGIARVVKRRLNQGNWAEFSFLVVFHFSSLNISPPLTESSRSQVCTEFNNVAEETFINCVIMRQGKHNIRHIYQSNSMHGCGREDWNLRLVPNHRRVYECMLERLA